MMATVSAFRRRSFGIEPIFLMATLLLRCTRLSILNKVDTLLYSLTSIGMLLGRYLVMLSSQ